MQALVSASGYLALKLTTNYRLERPAALTKATLAIAKHLGFVMAELSSPVLNGLAKTTQSKIVLCSS